MTATEIAGLVTAATALVTALGAFLSVVGHLIHHKNQDAAQGSAPPAGNSTTPHP